MILKHETTSIQFLMLLYKLFCHYYNSDYGYTFLGCTQIIAHSGKSEVDAKHKSLVHQYEQIKLNRSDNTNSVSLQRLFLCNILDLVNCCFMRNQCFGVFSTCMTEIFLIITKGRERVIQHCNLTVIYYQSRKCGFVLQ